MFEFLKTSRMSCLWVCLSLLCVATLIQSSASSEVSNSGVSLECNRTVEVVAGETVKLYCTISYLEQHCKGLHYLWNNTQGIIPCNSDLMKYSCEWDNLTSVSLTISNVTKEENYTVYIETDCGTAESSAIKVQLKQRSNSTYEVYHLGLSLECNKTVEVVPGEPVTLYCTYLEQHCKGKHYLWTNTSGNITCNSDLMKHNREWDNLTYVSLSISNVTEEENYTVYIETDCGTAESSAIKVQLKQQSNIIHEMSNPGVSLECNKTVEVVAGETMKLYCTISYLEQHCKGLRYLWRNTQGDIPCNSDLMKYSCEWDNLTYVSLIITNVMEEGNYTVYIETDCGTAESSAIKVQLKQQTNSTHGETGSEQLTKLPVAPTVLRMFTLIVLAILFFLFGTVRGRKLVKCIKKEKIPDDPSDMDTGPERRLTRLPD